MEHVGILSPCNYLLFCRLYMYRPSRLRPQILKLWRFFFTPSPKNTPHLSIRYAPQNCEVPPIEFCRSRNEGKRCRPKMRDTPFLEKKSTKSSRAENSPSCAERMENWNQHLGPIYGQCTYVWPGFSVDRLLPFAGLKWPLVFKTQEN